MCVCAGGRREELLVLFYYYSTAIFHARRQVEERRTTADNYSFHTLRRQIGVARKYKLESGILPLTFITPTETRALVFCEQTFLLSGTHVIKKPTLGALRAEESVASPR
jgi:hypothetical protein